MQIDKALQFAVVQSWDDLTRGSEPSSIRVEYQGDPGTTLDYLRIWSDRGGGYQRLVCDYWTWTSPAHPSGVRFTDAYHSDALGKTLDFIMKNQDQFARPSDACRDGLVLIYPPTGDERAAAATWTAENHDRTQDSDGVAVESVPLPGTSPLDSQPIFGMIAFAKRVDALARAATTEAIRLDAIEAPQREIQRQKREDETTRESLEKARRENKSNFRP